MLTILASRNVHPEIEAIDRDPGIVSLACGLARLAGTGIGAVASRLRGYRRVANDDALFSSATAWPHRCR